MTIKHQLLATSWSPVIAIAVLALTLAGCATTPGETTGSVASAPAAAQSEADWRRTADSVGAKYRANPRDAEAALQYARALRALGQRPQAAAVLEQASLLMPDNKQIIGAYGRALADVGQHKQAFDVLGARPHAGQS